jgi:hypothetical protein
MHSMHTYTFIIFHRSIRYMIMGRKIIILQQIYTWARTGQNIWKKHESYEASHYIMLLDNHLHVRINSSVLQRSSVTLQSLWWHALLSSATFYSAPSSQLFFRNSNGRNTKLNTHKSAGKLRVQFSLHCDRQYCYQPRF